MQSVFAYSVHQAIYGPVGLTLIAASKSLTQNARVTLNNNTNISEPE